MEYELFKRGRGKGERFFARTRGSGIGRQLLWFEKKEDAMPIHSVSWQ